MTSILIAGDHQRMIFLNVVLLTVEERHLDGLIGIIQLHIAQEGRTKDIFYAALNIILVLLWHALVGPQCITMVIHAMARRK